MQEVFADEGTVDALLGGRVQLWQPSSGYRVAIDPVLLAAATAAQPGDRVLELGCGTGAAALCLAVRVAGVDVVGLERYPPAVAAARRNVAANGLADRIAVVDGCLLAPPPAVTAAPFDRVMMNPPYLPRASATVSSDPWKAAANVESDACLGDWIAAAARLLAPRGVLTIIHRADRLDELMALLRPQFGGVVAFPLWPSAHADSAKRVLIAAARGSRAPMALRRGLVLHGGGGGYSEAARRILEDGDALVL